jgi:hypothetical protein
MKESSAILISTAYLAPVEYFARIIHTDDVYIEKEEHYIKQTYRNRCLICTANGIQPLIIPVIKVNGNRTKIKDMEISCAEKWQLNHWRAITSAYSNSPYFLYYKDELEPFFFNKYKYLLDFNTKLLTTVMEILDFDFEMHFTKSYSGNAENGITDLRNEISPKRKTLIQFYPYTQVFSAKFGFLPNLSIVDLIFNLGPESMKYLQAHR